MINVRLRITGEDERIQILTKTEADQFRLKFQFQMLLKGIYMRATDETDTQFRLIKNNEIIGYLFMVPGT